VKISFHCDGQLMAIIYSDAVPRKGDCICIVNAVSPTNDATTLNGNVVDVQWFIGTFSSIPETNLVEVKVYVEPAQ
jgi:hypothetical protein